MGLFNSLEQLLMRFRRANKPRHGRGKPQAGYRDRLYHLDGVEVTDKNIMAGVNMTTVTHNGVVVAQNVSHRVALDQAVQHFRKNGWPKWRKSNA